MKPRKFQLEGQDIVVCVRVIAWALLAVLSQLS